VVRAISRSNKTYTDQNVNPRLLHFMDDVVLPVHKSSPSMSKSTVEDSTVNSIEVYADHPCRSSRSSRKNRRRHGAAPRQLNPLKPQYCNLISLWRDNASPEPHNWIKEQFSDVSLPFVFDVGCGEGEWAMKTAKQSPDLNIVGLELRSAALTEDRRAHAKETPNLALLDANVLSGDLKTLFHDIEKAGGTVASVMVQCPDPHWKSKHKKRRILGSILIQTCFDCLTPEASLFVRTDVRVVAEDVSTLARRYFVEDSPDPLLVRLCGIPTERMLYVQRKGGSIHERMFRVKTDGGDATSEEDPHEDSEMEPLFGIYE
jgi:tRNA (guanine-N7-)-methyltransferase